MSRRIVWPDWMEIKKVRAGVYEAEGYRITHRGYTWRIDSGTFNENHLGFCRMPYGSLRDALQAIADRPPIQHRNDQ